MTTKTNYQSSFPTGIVVVVELLSDLTFDVVDGERIEVKSDPNTSK